MPVWRDVSFDDVETHGTKFMVHHQPFRFQIPKGRVLFRGLSEYKSISVEVPSAFIQWWRTSLEPTLAKGLVPFNSNAKETSLRIKIDTSTQFFNSAKEIYFPEVKEGLLDGTTVQCIVEVTGTYFFQGSHGLIVRAHQVVVVSESSPPPVIADEEDPVTPLKGFAFTLPGDSGYDAGETSRG